MRTSHTSESRRELYRPGGRVFRLDLSTVKRSSSDPLDCGLDFVAQILAQTRALLIVKANRVAEVIPGGLDESYVHGSSNSRKT